MRIFLAILAGLGVFALLMAGWLALLAFVLYPIGIVAPIASILSFMVGMLIGPISVMVGYLVLDD